MVDLNKVRTEPAIDSESSGKTFARVFGTNTSAFELLALKRKIVGPCWLQIKKPHAENKGVSLRGPRLRDSSSYFYSIDFVVQVRGDRVRPQRH